MGPDKWQQVMDVNLNGFYNVTQPLSMPMIRTRWGRIITSTSSGTAFGFTCSTCVKACRIVMFFTSSYKNQGRRAFLPVAPV